ncbi:macro domain-containing protein [Cystoisospora suis]|uniref:Macro domain-containing protein n=1 Tax=Cystoisospora suis TaxID=483139 RepID=A0A2C6LCF7_9APIC|nr:macro domain-containing protein [Cystoisospora suis]
MEKLREKLVAVVLVVPDDSQEDGEGEKAYEHFIKLYFPRSPFEEAEALIHLPQETGDIYGQIEVSERRIRIDKDGYKRNQKSPSSSSKMYTGSESSSTGRSAPHQFGRLLMRPDDDDDDEDGDGNFALNRKGQEEEDEDEFDHVILRCTDVSFTDAQSSTETERRLKALTSSPGIQDPVYGWEEDSETVYHRYLRQASAIGDCVAFRQLDKLNFLYPCSTDKAGRRVIVFLAALFPSSAVDAGIVLLYIIKTLDPYIRDKYTLLYVNTEVHHSNMPCMALWKEFFNLFPKYENTLDQLLVLHPGILFKTAFACCWPYISSSIWNGTIYLDHIQDLYKHIDEKTLLLPNYVKEYDQKNSSSSTQKLAHLLSRLSL